MNIGEYLTVEHRCGCYKSPPNHSLEICPIEIDKGLSVPNRLPTSVHSYWQNSLEIVNFYLTYVRPRDSRVLFSYSHQRSNTLMFKTGISKIEIGDDF